MSAKKFFFHFVWGVLFLLTACAPDLQGAGGDGAAALEAVSWPCGDAALDFPNGSAYTPTDPSLRALAAARTFHIGGAVDPAYLYCDNAYAAIVSREFNILTTENALKFWPVHPAPERYDFSGADAVVAFAAARGIAIRGHALVWHEATPPWIAEATFTPEQWEATLRDHITAVVGRYRGRVAYWDVVNEAVGDGGGLRESVWLAGVGPDYVDKAFRWAHAADPDAQLFYNDYGAEGLSAKSEEVYALVRGMLERGVPIHGVGFQMHITLEDAPRSEDVLRNLHRLGELGLDVHITELDVRLPSAASVSDLTRQAALYRDLLAVCLSADNCTAFVLWGVTDRYSWIPGFFPGYDHALIFDRDYRAKPAYFALREALRAP